jgi:hypothetical protein
VHAEILKTVEEMKSISEQLLVEFNAYSEEMRL